MKHSARDLLKKRYEDRDKGGSRLQALDFKNKDVTFWKLKYDESGVKSYINILPYEIKTKNHPLVRSGDAEVGDEDSAFDVWVHQYIGPAHGDVICPQKMFFKKCPICEQGEKFRSEGKKDEASKCNPSHKVYYNIVDVKEPEKGVQIFQTSFKNFHKELMDEAGDAGENGEILDFVDFKHGKVVQFRATETNKGGMKFPEFRSFKFQDREEPLDKSLKDDVISFDEFMVMHTYEELEKIFYGDDEDTSNSKDDDEEEEEDEVENNKDEGGDEEEKPVKTNKSKRVVDEDEDEDNPVPVKNEKRVEKTRKVNDDEDDENPLPKHPAKDLEDEDSTLEAAKKAVRNKKSSGDAQCPNDLTFGKDFESDDVCDNCDKYKECYKANRALKGRKSD